MQTYYSRLDAAGKEQAQRDADTYTASFHLGAIRGLKGWIANECKGRNDKGELRALEALIHQSIASLELKAGAVKV